MGLISEYVEVGLAGKNVKYYEEKGYKIPKYKNNLGKIKVKKGTKILIKTEDLSNNSKIKVIVKCDCQDCNKIKRIRYDSYIQTMNKYGKYYCRQCSMRLFHSGENSYNWVQSITQEEREEGRYTLEYNNFIRKVLKRDNYTCQVCKKSSKEIKLKVHHIDGYNWCKERRTDESNGITLCETCHKNFHSKYGYGGNTRQQFEEWIGHAIGGLEKYNVELPTTRKVYCYEDNKVYDSVLEFLRVNDYKKDIGSQVYSVCNNVNNRKTVKRKHVMWYEDYLKLSQEELTEKINKSKITKKKSYLIKLYQYDLNYNLVNIWSIQNDININLTPKEEKIENGFIWCLNEINKKQIYCIEENKIYNGGVSQFKREHNIKSTSKILSICNHKLRKDCGYDKSIKGYHILWYEDYLKLNEEEIKLYLKWCNSKNTNIELLKNKITFI